METTQKPEWSRYDADESGVERPKPKMVRAFIRVPRKRTVTRPRIKSWLQLIG